MSGGPGESQAVICSVSREGEQANTAPNSGFKVVYTGMVTGNAVKGGPGRERESLGIAGGEADSGGAT